MIKRSCLFPVLTLVAMSASDAHAGEGASGAMIFPGKDDRGHFQEVLISYSGLADKGLFGARIRAGAAPFTQARPRPPVLYLPQGPYPDREGRRETERVEVSLVETLGIARPEADIAFGFPLEKGAVFNLDRLKVVDLATSEELSIQVTALALWGDGSIKSALIQFQAPVAASGAKRVAVEFGRDVTRGVPAGNMAALKVAEGEGQITVSTGVIEAVIGKEGFLPLREVRLVGERKKRLIAKATGIELRDESGKLHSTAFSVPEEIRIERKGPRDVVFRVEGKFTDTDSHPFMRYVARLRFVAGSSRVDLSVTLLNDELEREFTDFTSLGFAIDFPKAKEWSASVDLGGEGMSRGANALSLTQWSETTALLKVDGDEGSERPLRSTGFTRLNVSGGEVAVGMRDFWQRWPKGITAKPGSLRLDLLPQQPVGFGTDLPAHLAFPFVEGRYRMKWGMSFTERMSFDFMASGETMASEIAAPVVAVIPPVYIASTGVFGKLPVSKSAFGVSQWNACMDQSLIAYRGEREKEREFGFLNWGDWFGERGRNWGNNEYDRAHGLAQQFLATGQPEYLSEAIVAARHQADVDIVHAYPDPFYIGANLQHGIGHSGSPIRKSAREPGLTSTTEPPRRPTVIPGATGWWIAGC